MQYGGVIGAFNCQGAGWDPREKKIKGYPEYYKIIYGSVHVNDIKWYQKQVGMTEEYVTYLKQDEELLLVSFKSSAMQIIMQASSFMIFNFELIKKFN